MGGEQPLRQRVGLGGFPVEQASELVHCGPAGPGRNGGEVGCLLAVAHAGQSVGVTFAALLGGLITTITVSSLHRKQASADSVARSAAEWIKDGVQTPYANCAGAGTYSLSGLPTPSGYSVAIQSVEYWDGAGPVAGTPYSLDSHIGQPCPASGDKGVQRITIVVTSSNPQVSETVQVLNYAARVIQLAEKRTGRSIEPEFVERVSHARSNIPEKATGREIYTREVAAMRLDRFVPQPGHEGKYTRRQRCDELT